MRINRQDTNGVKPLLAVGELGYDNYPTGGDAGRVYVGNGSINIPQANKSEVIAVDGKVDTHVGRVDNPHAVTKAQVGLSNVDNTSDANKPVSTSTQNALNLKANIASPTFTGTVTAPTFSGSLSGNASSATKLETARTINGVSFDGTTNITAPTNLGITAGTTAGPIVTSSSGTNATLPSASATASGVVTTEAQTFAGIKTFTSSPIVPTPTADTQAVNKQYVDGKYSGFKNYIINGNFDIWQYGTNQTTEGYGSDDRWFNSGAVSIKTHSQVACTDIERALFNASNFSRTVVTSVVGPNINVTKRQAIEDVTKLAGKTVTLSFWAKADTTKNIWVEFKQVFGTGGSPSATVMGIYGQPIQLTSTWQKKTITVTLPSIIGKTLGTDGVHTTATELQFWFNVGSIYIPRIPTGIQQSGTFDIAQVQLEEGTVSTPFENRPYGLELSLCQRYLPSLKQATFCISGQAISSTVARFVYKLAVQPRVPPTGLLITSGNGVTQILNSSGVGITTSAPSTLWFSSINGVAFTGTVSGGLTAGDACLGNIDSILFTGCEL